ncbi:MAG: hypothetical protein IBJ11_05560 [Phycisphaerales bacterium]|nr:hypothetical protein [Phycisphaerales bacterium]
MRRAVTFSSAVGGWAVGLALAASPPAAPPPQAEGPVPLDPAVLWVDLAKAYRSQAIAEQVTVSVGAIPKPDGRPGGGGSGGAGAAERRDSFVLRIVPGQGGPTAEVVLGDIVVWMDRSAIRAVHRMNASSYFEVATDGRPVTAVLGEVLPPLPAPQLSLAFDEAPLRGRWPNPTPYSLNVAWLKGQVFDRPPATSATAEGVGDAVGVTLEAHPDPPVFRRLTVDFAGEDRRVVVAAARMPPPVDRIGVDVAGRRRVAGIRELGPMPGDLGVGTVMPALVLRPAAELLTPDAPPAAEPDAGPMAWVLVRTPERAREAVEALGPPLGASPGVGMRVVAVLDLGRDGAQLRERLAAFAAASGGRPLRFSVSPPATIDRFPGGKESGAVLVVTDAARVIRSVTILDRGGAESGALARAIAEALKPLAP